MAAIDDGIREHPDNLLLPAKGGGGCLPTWQMLLDVMALKSCAVSLLSFPSFGVKNAPFLLLGHQDSAVLASL